MKSLSTLAALSAAVGLLSLAPASIAQVGDPTVDVYGGAPGGTQTQVGGVNADTAAPTAETPAGGGAVRGVTAQGRPSAPRAGGAGGQAADSPVEAAGDRLAFTGLDVGLVLGAGVLLLLVGTTVRWLTRPADTVAP